MMIYIYYILNCEVYVCMSRKGTTFRIQKILLFLLFIDTFCIQRILSFLLFLDTFRIQKCLETVKGQKPLK